MSIDKNKIVTQAQKYTAKGQFDKAIVEYLKLLKVEPNDIRTWLKVGDLYTRKGARKEATDTYIKVAEHYTKSGFHLKAVAVYKQVLKLDPTLLEVYQYLASAYLDLGLTSEALIQLEQLADMYQRTGREEKMLRALMQMAEIDPHNVATRLRIAEHLSKHERVPEAVENFAVACQELRAQGRADDYMKVAERLLYHDGSQVDVAREIARLYLEREQYKRALSRLQLCFVKDPRDAITLELLARSFHGLGQPDKAISVYKEMAHLLREQGDEARRRAVLETILTINPADELAMSELGYAAAARASHAPAAQAQVARQQENRLSVPPRPAGLFDGLPSPAESFGFDSNSAGDDLPSPMAALEPGIFVSEVPASPIARASFASPAEPARSSVPDPPRFSVPAPRAEPPSEPELSPAEAEELTRKRLAETDVLLKYGLKDRALDHVKKIFEFDPYNIDAREKIKDIYLEMDRVEDALSQLFLLADAFREDQPEGAVYYLHEVLKIDSSNARARRTIRDLGGVMPEELSDAPPSVAAPSTAPAEEPEEEPEEEPSGSVYILDEDELEEEPLTEDGLDDALQAPAGPSHTPPTFFTPARRSTPPARDSSPVVDMSGWEIEEGSSVQDLALGLDDLPVEQQASEDDSLVDLVVADEDELSEEHESPAPLPFVPQLRFFEQPSGAVPSDNGEESTTIRAEPIRAAATPPVELPDLFNELEELDFFIEQELFDEAKVLLDDLVAKHPYDPRVQAAASSFEFAINEFTSTEQPKLLAPSPAPPAADSLPMVFDPTSLVACEELADDSGTRSGALRLDTALGQFKVEVQNQVEDTDFTTHYDLGMAYREMQIFDDAIKEFRIAATNPAKSAAAQAKMMISMCHADLGNMDEALGVLSEAIDTPGLGVQEALGLRYELGKTYEAMGRKTDALSCFDAISKVDGAFADVSSRVKALRGGAGQARPGPF